jgi:membrane-associated protein
VLLAFNVLSAEDWIKAVGLAGLIAIIFAESGLLVGFFLPGDSLLFVAGAIAGGAFSNNKSSALYGIHFNIWVLLIGVVVAAIAGDQVGYAMGRKAGPAMFARPASRLFKQEYVEKSEAFFDRHGPRAVILARFVPIVRTFTPVIAGVSKMKYSTFIRFNVVGGFLWGMGVTLLGYWLGQVSFLQKHIELMILAIVAISLVPLAVEFLRHRRQAKAAADASATEV